MCTIDYDDPVRVYRESPRIARKEHECSGCGAVIRNGEAYCYVSYVDDYRGNSEHECFACWWTRSAFWAEHNGGPLPSLLWEELRDCIGGERTNTWRPHLAALQRRWRTSSIGRRELARTIFRAALSRQFSLTRRILRMRAEP